MMTDLTPLLSDPSNTVALVGATDNPWKYGSIIFRDLTAKGIRVVPVNPNRPTVAGVPAYPNLSALPEQPAIINIVVPPEEALGVVEEARGLGWDNLWLQPGAFDDEVIDALESSGLVYQAGACIMVRARLVGS